MTYGIALTLALFHAQPSIDAKCSTSSFFRRRGADRDEGLGRTPCVHGNRMVRSQAGKSGGMNGPFHRMQ